MFLDSYITKRIDAIAMKHMETRKHELPEGFHPLSEFEKGLRCVLNVPWGPQRYTMVFRVPSGSETLFIEKLINARIENGSKPPDNIEWLNQCNDLCKSILLSPTYEEIEKSFIEKVPEYGEGMKAFKELEKTYIALAEKNHIKMEQIVQLIGREKWNEFCFLSCKYDCVFPENFTIAVVGWARGNHHTDAETISAETLIDCYIMAEKYNKSPHEYLPGCFVSGTEMEIDAKAAMLYNEKKKKEKKGR